MQLPVNGIPVQKRNRSLYLVKISPVEKGKESAKERSEHLKDLVNPSKIPLTCRKRKSPGEPGLLCVSKQYTYLLLLFDELFLEALLEEELPFLAAPLLLVFEEALLLPLEALLLEVALLALLFLAALFVLAPPFFAALLVPALLLFLLALLAAPPFFAALFVAPFDAPFEELFEAPFAELLPAAFFAVAMLF